MPCGDGTGPRWAGGNWRCMGGRGRGPGFGRPRFACFEPPDKEAEVQNLKSYADSLKNELDAVQKKIKELSKK